MQKEHEETITEWCSYCGSEEEINSSGGQCSKCGRYLKPCSMCDNDVVNCNECLF